LPTSNRVNNFKPLHLHWFGLKRTVSIFVRLTFAQIGL
jgi:hypothetical protein